MNIIIAWQGWFNYTFILCLFLKVTYQTDFFLDKNKDYVVAEHQSLLSASQCSFVSSLFPVLPEESSKSSKFSSIGSRFKVIHYYTLLYYHRFVHISLIYRVVSFWLIITVHVRVQQQLQALLETLSSTEPHYIRCVKPNNLLKPAIFENKNVLQQLRCGVRKFTLYKLPKQNSKVFLLIIF